MIPTLSPSWISIEEKVESWWHLLKKKFSVHPLLNFNWYQSMSHHKVLINRTWLNIKWSTIKFLEHVFKMDILQQGHRTLMGNTTRIGRTNLKFLYNLMTSNLGRSLRNYQNLYQVSRTNRRKKNREVWI